ncbi:NAD-dependent epimerase/dehydratase family protein [Patescibacteria group bacterium]|nr:NAD-dependent epimerase/dehydratase family protein [Patescibacteria group bacterium]
MERCLLITGMGGAIGRHVARMGLEQGYRVFGTVLNSVPKDLIRLSEKGEISIIRADLSQEEQTMDAIFTAKPDVIVNLAGRTENSYGFDGTVRDENMTIVKNLLDCVSFLREDGMLEGFFTFIQPGTIWQYGQVFGEESIVTSKQDVRFCS